jgi:hypothetical protein
VVKGEDAPQSMPSDDILQELEQQFSSVISPGLSTKSKNYIKPCKIGNVNLNTGANN